MSNKIESTIVYKEAMNLNEGYADDVLVFREGDSTDFSEEAFPSSCFCLQL